MNLGADLAKVVIKIFIWIFRIIWKPIIAIVKFTMPFGLFIAWAWKKLLLDGLTHIDPDNVIVYYVLLSLGILMTFLFTTRNLIRLFTRNPRWGWIRLISGNLISEKAVLKGNTKPMERQDNDVSGVLFGQANKKYVTQKETEDGHILVVGGPASGKTSCVAIPSLMTWKDRVFAIDIKGELSTKSGRTGIIFNPCNPDCSYGYDPYYLLSVSKNRVQDAREIALMLIPISNDIKDPFWKQSAQNLLTASILYFHKCGLNFPKTLEAIQTTPTQILVEIISNSDDNDSRMFVNQFIGLDPKTLAGIATELSNSIMIFATDPELKAALSKDICINPKLIEQGKDVFIQIPEDKLELWRNLLTLIIQQFLKHFERRLDGEGTPVLVLLDEFARLGKLDTIQNGLATLRSKKIHICIITQSLAQIDFLYGKSQSQSIVNSCSYKAILKASDDETQRSLSNLVGTYEKQKITQSANFEQYTKLGKGTGRSITTQRERIIQPEEFAYLEDIVLLAPTGFMRVEKVSCYTDKRFRAVNVSEEVTA